MIKLNCDAANKLVKSLNADRAMLLSVERDQMLFTGTDAERKSEAPVYNLFGTQRKLDALAEKVFALKHAINKFNTTTVLDGLGFTLDEALVRMAVLNEQKAKLDSMRAKPAVMRPRDYGRVTLGSDREYTYRMYSDEDADAEYRKVSNELVAIQQAINLANITIEFEVEIDL